MRKFPFIILTVLAGIVLLGFDLAYGVEDFVVAVEKSTLVKTLGIAGLALLAEIWRNQRALFRKNEALGNQLAHLIGYCKGKSKECDPDYNSSGSEPGE